MLRICRYAGAAAAMLILLAAPMTSLAQGGHATSSCPTKKVHSLPSGSANLAVIKFGVQGGSLRPWSVQFGLDGTITPTVLSLPKTKFADPKNALRGLLALADAEGFFSMKKAIGCLGSGGNPDVSSRYIMIHSSAGTRHVNSFGSCTATAKFDQIYAVLEETAGIGS